MPRPGLVERIVAKARKGRSEPYRWLWENYAEIETVLALRLRGGWRLIAEDAAGAKVLDADGKPPTPDAMRAAWQRVLKDRARLGESLASDPRSARQSPSARSSGPPAPPSAISLTADTQDDEEQSSEAFPLSSPKR